MVAAAPQSQAPNSPAPQTPPVPGPAATPAPSPPPARITTPEAFLRALICSDFDFPAIAAQVDAARLLAFVKDPTVLAELQSVTSLSNLCLELRQSHFRSIALTELADVVHKAQDPTERRLAATALLRATGPARAAAKAPAAPEAEDMVPVPPPVAVPTPALTAQQVADQLTLAVEQLHHPQENSGLSTLAAFCDDDAQLNAQVLPTDDVRQCVEALVDSPISLCVGVLQRIPDKPLKVAGDTATYSVAWALREQANPLCLSLNLKRADVSRCPGAWLITSMRLGEWQNPT